LAITVACNDVGRDFYVVVTETTFCPTSPSSRAKRISEFLNPVMLQIVVQTPVDFSKLRPCVENPTDETSRVTVINESRAQKYQSRASRDKWV